MAVDASSTNRGVLSDLPQDEHFFPLKSPPKKDKFAVGPDNILFATVLQRNSARARGGGFYCTQQRPLHTKRTGYVTVGLKPETSVQSLLWTTNSVHTFPGNIPLSPTKNTPTFYITQLYIRTPVTPHTSANCKFRATAVDNITAVAMPKPMPSIVLTYFDIPGPAEAIRLAFYIAGVPFEDRRVSRNDFANMKAGVYGGTDI